MERFKYIGTYFASEGEGWTQRTRRRGRSGWNSDATAGVVRGEEAGWNKQRGQAEHILYITLSSPVVMGDDRKNQMRFLRSRSLELECTGSLLD